MSGYGPALRSGAYVWAERFPKIGAGRVHPTLWATGLPATAASAGLMLTASAGNWRGNPVPGTSFQWWRGNATISAATNKSYQVQVADSASDVCCVVQGSNKYGTMRHATPLLRINLP